MINIIHPQTKAPEKWFAFPGASDEKYLLRYVPTNALPDIRDERSLVDWINFYKGITRKCLVDWQGVNGENDEPIPCTDETKELFMREASGAADERMRWFSEIVSNKNKFTGVDELIKNLKAPSNGASHTHAQPISAA